MLHFNLRNLRSIWFLHRCSKIITKDYKQQLDAITSRHLGDIIVQATEKKPFCQDS